MEEDIKKMVEYANKIIEIANGLKDKQNGLIYKNICKNCGKEIIVARKNIRFCDAECKKEYVKKRQKEYQNRRKQNLTEEEKRIENQKCAERMRELRKLRKNAKEGK